MLFSLKGNTVQVKYTIPTTKYMSSCVIIGTSSSIETAEENALWFYNDSRGHDGLPPLNQLPKGTKSEPIIEIEPVQQ